MWWKILLVTLGVIIVVIASAIIVGNTTFKRKVNREIEAFFQLAKDINPKVITEDDIEGLPEPVQRYLRYSQVIGKETIGTVRLKQQGLMRMNEDQKWMSLEAEEYYTTDPPGFVWTGSIDFAPLFSVKARDMLSGGEGSMSVKLLGLISVVDSTGPEMNQASLVRYLSETIWFPTVLLSEYIQWELVDTNSAKATISVNGLTASAVFHFNERGELENLITERYFEEDGQYTLQTWSTPITEYKEINGIRMPSKGNAVWNLSSGDFKYIEIEITELEYDNPTVYP